MASGSIADREDGLYILYIDAGHSLTGRRRHGGL
jgi:hypothetical protein